MATEHAGQTPRAVIHKRILEEASEHPDASLQELAEETSGASTDLVEKVLADYGDPADKPQQSVTTEEPVADSSHAGPPPEEETRQGEAIISLEDLSTKQRDTLRQIDEEPTATQREIGEALDVSPATISNRLSDIAGFDWQNRQEFVSRFFRTALIGDGHGQAEQEASANIESQLNQLEARLSAIETAIPGSSLPAELAHKVLHACMNSDEFSEEEELELIGALFSK